MRRAAKRDDNHAEIVAALRKAGGLVLDLGAVGGGCPDLLVWRAGVFKLLEVKDGAKSASRRELTPDQVKFHAIWPVTVVCSVDEAISAIFPSVPSADG